MRPEAIEPVKRAVQRATSLGLDGTFLYLTKTGHEKSIMDATAPVRDYLFSEGVHDYSSQGQGSTHKHRVKAYFVTPRQLIETTASLYRPPTKMGDPRIWFDGLGKYASAGSVLCLLAHEHEIFVLNAEDEMLWESINIFGSPLQQLVSRLLELQNHTANRLYDLIKERTKFPLRTICAGPTGVGATLEHVLGIPINSSRAPDWHGIELKSGRRKKGPNVRSTLFAQVPNWEISNIKSSKEMVFKHGYFRQGFQRLNCQVSAVKINSQGLFLSMDEKAGILHERCAIDPVKVDPKTLKSYQEVVAWEIKILKERLQEKHKETFWVSAHASGKGEEEVFDYYEIQHTKRPLINSFSTLLDTGIVTLDHLIKCESPESVAKERGPLFKIDKKNFGLLFPPSNTYSLK
ncbi:MAG: MvaI/BcnI family restriction endonuclease [Oxalicibacterium faecigallinarum]|uniref:MvaI/BcnI family restriction endonuclease n=1 Tax=Oxalicibacterium faecigallinarum TaxID=573741 RepID=UPI0028096414|nr:MvaI/BcnI family restriction endonuclease [Oxalicibacterium faecigallinarum]MDQ7968703.1 MvaI/BcnI family restriction endonuclease [Oxalicibacterium faecigallinarum]